MDVRSKLISVRVPRRPQGVVLVLHGGGSRSAGVRVSPTQLSVLRMIPIARKIARAGHGRLAVFRLLNSARGWDTDHTPVEDVRWALAEIRERFGSEVPVCLVGHSLGGRAAVLAAGEAGVRSVVALAPYVYSQDADVAAPNTSFLFVHGTDDRIASPERSEATARRLQNRAHVEFVRVRSGKHAMLRRHRVFSRLAASFAVATLTGSGPDDHPAVGSGADTRGSFTDA